MKRFILSMAVMLMTVFSASAMSYEQARDRALFLTDKMAYELNLNDEQYEAAYEVNLDYLMSINTYDDLYGTYWTRRNLDLSYILFDWQYRAFCSAAYFYRPLSWTDGVWRFSIYARYPRRTYFYFGRPRFYATYCGGHSWRMNGGRSWYHGRDFGPRPDNRNFGMRDRFDRGDFRGTRNHGGGFDRNNGRPGWNDRRQGWNDNGNRPGRNDNGNNRPGRNDNDRRQDNNNNGMRPGRNDNGQGNNGGYRGGNNSRPGSVTITGPGERKDRQPFARDRQPVERYKVNPGNFGRFTDLRESSTRTTVTRTSPSTFDRPSAPSNSRPSTTFTPSRNNSSNSSFGGGSSNRGGSSFNGGSSNRGGFSGGGRSGGGGHIGGRR